MNFGGKHGLFYMKGDNRMRIGIDLGGTKIAAGLVDENRNVIASVQEATDLPKPAEEIVLAVYNLVHRLLKEEGFTFEQVESIGIGIPGTVNKETDVVEYANNFGFEHVPFVKMLKEKFPCPLYAENDANAAAWGEYLAGGGRGSRSMVAVTLGTGVGGGIILNGRIWGGENGAGGELGHIVIEKGGRPCTCGRKGCLEAYASATALVSQTQEAMENMPASLLWTLCDGELENVNGRMVFEAVAKKDETAVAIRDNFIDYLAEGVASIINTLQPEVLCIGGGLSGAGAALLEPLQMKTAPLVYSRSSKKNTRLVLAELGNDAGIIGAACLDEQCADNMCKCE